MLLALIAVSAAALLTTALWLRARGALRAMTAERDEYAILLKRRLAPPPTPARRSMRAMRAVVETAVEGAARYREGGVTGLLSSSIDDLITWGHEDQTTLTELAAPDGTVAILFSDIEDSTTLNDQLGDDQWVALIGAHDKVVTAQVERFGGVIVKSQGDGFMIAFAEGDSAVRAGIGIQDAINSGAHRLLRRTPIKVRVGINCGTVVHRDGDLFGTNVAIAARVAAKARGGQILVTDEVRVALREVPDIVLVDAFETELKGLPGTFRLWEVALI